MRIKILSILISLLLTGNYVYSANAASKISAGTKCPKIGATKLYKGKKFTCVNLGKKLLWDNGVISSEKPIDKSVVPATCTSQNVQARIFREDGGANFNGKVIFSAEIINSSPTEIANNVKIYIEWFDGVGLSYKRTLKMPKIYPGQKIGFGDWNPFSDSGSTFPREPNRVNLRSTCTSMSSDSIKSLNGKIPVITGDAPIKVQKFSAGRPDAETYVSASFVLTNIFDKDIVISNETNSVDQIANLYGLIKDKFGNVLGGYFGSVSGNLEILEPGESIKVDQMLLEFADVDSDIIDRMAIFSYTIMVP